ncbi:unnamed protein product [Durusdinium trenchii]|uniref:Coiled-coil domain-containing protein n=1 Tax=Durusdinium trenchii TaxID=1381693 RepID=A0ABP0ME73_9DINO
MPILCSVHEVHKAKEIEPIESALLDHVPGTVKKAQRAADAAAKADAKLAAKAELKELERQEEEANSQMKGANKKGSGYAKVTQAEIARRQALMGAMAKANPKKQVKKTEVVSQPKLEANTNRQEDVVDASGIDAALSALDAGVEKKPKMTYAEYEARELEGIRQENPGLKMSQAKERCFKMWERSPENPKNQDK